MDALSAHRAPHLALWHEAAHRVARLGWNLRLRWQGYLLRQGLWGVLMPLALLLCVLAAWAKQEQRQQLATLQASWVRLSQTEAANPALKRSSSARDRLQAFLAQLPAHDSLPFAVQDLLRLAEEQRLSVRMGQYHAELDRSGGFALYRMDMPVSGSGPDIQRFIQLALGSQKSLALQSLRFKREHAQAGDVVVQIQWQLLTQLPGVRSSALATPGLTPGGSLLRVSQ